MRVHLVEYAVSHVKLFAVADARAAVQERASEEVAHVVSAARCPAGQHCTTGSKRNESAADSAARWFKVGSRGSDGAGSAARGSQRVPDAFLCPIMHEIMRDPVSSSLQSFALPSVGSMLLSQPVFSPTRLCPPPKSPAVTSLNATLCRG